MTSGGRSELFPSHGPSDRAPFKPFRFSSPLKNTYHTALSGYSVIQEIEVIHFDILEENCGVFPAKLLARVLAL